jgi:pseudaminic acid cytidylyltransferase
VKAAIIPARGGSKRIPRKNVRLFAGRPIIHYAIAAALGCGKFDRIIVSTDDEDIADVARAGGAEVPFIRPASIADDHADTACVIAHALQELNAAGEHADVACCLYPTAPMIDVNDLIAASELLDRDAGVDYVFAAARFSYPVQRGFTQTQDGSIVPLYPQHRATRSQDLPAVFHDAGQFYWGRVQAWLEMRPIFGAASRCVELPPWRTQDIDTEDDWQMAERLFAAAKYAIT